MQQRNAAEEVTYKHIVLRREMWLRGCKRQSKRDNKQQGFTCSG